MAANETALSDYSGFTYTSQKFCSYFIYYIRGFIGTIRFSCGYHPFDSEHELNMTDTSSPPSKLPPERTTPPSSSRQSSYNNEELLQFVVLKVLFPIVMILIAICIVLGVILVVKTYMMAPIKHNLATAIRRRRRFGHAPDNNYVPSEEMRASQRWSISNPSDRKSLPPPEVLMAARARASQMLHV